VPKTTLAASREHQRRAAVRALDDPAQLARAARIVRAALERGQLVPADLDGPIVQPVPDE
jgi:hypothetical protein